MSDLRREFSIVVDDMEYGYPMKLNARITKDANTDDPDFCEISIYNLKRETMTAMLEAKKAQVYAGYNGTSDIVFSGDIQAVMNKKSGTEWITTLYLGDGATVMKQSIINKTYSKPTSNRELIEDIAISSGLSKDVEFNNVNDTKKALRGSTRTGNAWKEIESICKPNGWKCNIQQERLVITAPEGHRTTEAFVISVETGMIGSPEWINTGNNVVEGGKEKTEQKMRVDSLCIPQIEPSDRVKIISTSSSGRSGSFVYDLMNNNEMNDIFIVDRVTHDLDSREGHFKTSIEATFTEGTTDG